MSKRTAWACAGMVVSGLMFVAGIVVTTMPVNFEAATAHASTKHKENPLRTEVFETGASSKITRVYDTETGFVCYYTNWSDATARIGPCREVKRSAKINSRYGLN